MQGASLDYERSSDGSQAYVRIVGTIDERFEGKKVASRIKSDSVVINCAGVTLITSFGIRAWLDFVKSFEKRKLDLTFVECSPSFVNELNQVVDFAGEGTVLSCYTPYICPSCSSQRSVLLRTDLDADVIKNREAPEYSCLVCGNTLEFDEDPASYFPGLDSHVSREIDNKVLAFLEARLNYESAAHRQLRILKDVQGAATVLSFSGTLDGTLQGEKQAQGLQGNVIVDLTSIIHVQQQGLRVFREFLDHATLRTDRLWLVGCPALIIERALEPHNVEAGVQVVSVRLPYHCFKCEGTEFVDTDLASRDGAAIRNNQLGPRTCSGCKGESNPMVGVKVLETLRQLPFPDITRGARKSVEKAAKRRTRAKKRRAGQRAYPAWMIAAGAAALVGAAVALVIVATVVLRSNKASITPPPDNATATSDRPEWIVSDSPGAAYCVDLGWQLQCVGVSLFAASLEEAEREAYLGAFEAFVHTALLAAPSPAIEGQRRAYLPARNQVQSELEQAYRKSEPAQMKASRDILRGKHAAVVELSKLQAAPGNPNQRSDSYWEEYAEQGGATTEFLAFVRMDVGNAEVKAYTSYYTSTTEVEGATLSPVIPTIAWLFDPAGKRAYYVSAVDDGAFAVAGLEKGDIVVTDAKIDEVTPENVVIRRGDKFAEVQP